MSRTCSASRAIAGSLWRGDKEIGPAHHTCTDPAWCAGIGRLTAPGPRFTLGAEWRPGSEITWMHVYPSGERFERTGVVWCDAPLFDGATRSVWVTPDRPLPSDYYTVIAVGKAGRDHDAHGSYGAAPGGRVHKGDAFSSNLISSPSGNLAAQAVQLIRQGRL